MESGYSIAASAQGSGCDGADPVSRPGARPAPVSGTWGGLATRLRSGDVKL